MCMNVSDRMCRIASDRMPYNVLHEETSGTTASVFFIRTVDDATTSLLSWRHSQRQPHSRWPWRPHLSFGNIPKCSRKFWNILEFSQHFLGNLGEFPICSRQFWKKTKISRTFWEFQKNSRTCWKIQTFFTKFTAIFIHIEVAKRKTFAMAVATARVFLR